MTKLAKKMRKLYPVPEAKRAGCGLYQEAKAAGKDGIACPTPLFACHLCVYYRGIEHRFESPEHEDKRLKNARGRPNRSGVDWTNGTHAECMRRLRANRRAERPHTAKLTDHPQLMRAYHFIYAQILRWRQRCTGAPLIPHGKQFDITRYVLANCRRQAIIDGQFEIPLVLEGFTADGAEVCFRMLRRSARRAGRTVDSDYAEKTDRFAVINKLRTRAKQ